MGVADKFDRLIEAMKVENKNLQDDRTSFVLDGLKKNDTPVELSKKESRARQEALRALRSGKQKGMDYVGAGGYADVYGEPGSDYVVKTPKSRKKNVIKVRPSVENSWFSGGFWEDISDKAINDKLLGEDLAYPTHAIKTSKGEYGVQKKAPKVLDNTIEKYVEGRGQRFPEMSLKEISKGFNKSMDRLYTIQDKLSSKRLEHNELQSEFLNKNTNDPKLMKKIEKVEKDIKKMEKKAEKAEAYFRQREETFDDLIQDKSGHKTLKKFTSKYKDTLADAVEDKGLVPKDLHSGNIGYDPKTKTGKVIDSGLFTRGKDAAEKAYDASKKTIMQYGRRIPKMSKYLKTIAPPIGYGLAGYGALSGFNEARGAGKDIPDSLKEAGKAYMEGDPAYEFFKGMDENAKLKGELLRKGEAKKYEAIKRLIEQGR